MSDKIEELRKVVDAILDLDIDHVLLIKLDTICSELEEIEKREE